MHTSNVVFVFLVVVLTFASHPGIARSNEVRIGDSRDSVVEALGEPQGTTAFADVEVLYYPRGKIEIESGHVVSHSLISQEELEKQTEKRLMEKEARRAREALRREQQAEDQKKAVQQEGRSVPPKGDDAREIYKIGTSSDETPKNAFLFSSRKYKGGSMFGLSKKNWKESKIIRDVPYLIVKQGKNPTEIALYRKHPRSNTDETFLFYVRRQDPEKTLTLHTRFRGDDPKYWLEFDGNGEVLVYKSDDRSKASDWSYLVKRYQDEEGRLYVSFHTNIRQPLVIIEVDKATRKTGIFRAIDESQRPQSVPVRVYDPLHCSELHDDFIHAPYNDEVIGIIAAVDVLQRKKK